MNRIHTVQTAAAARAARCLAAVVVAAGICAVASTTAAAPELRVEFSMYEIGSETLRYRGTRTIREAEGLVTLRTTYTRPDGTPVQNAELVFHKETLVPRRYVRVDSRSGEREELRRQDGAMRWKYRETADSASETEEVEWATGTVFSTALFTYVRQHWQQLARGETLEFDQFVFSRSGTIGFRISRDEARTPGTPPGLVLRMEPSNWLIRQLVNPIRLVFALAPPHRVLIFEGRVPLKTDGGDTQDLRTEYRYPAG